MVRAWLPIGIWPRSGWSLLATGSELVCHDRPCDVTRV